MARKLQRQLFSFAREIGVYTALMVGYLLLVVHFLGDWLHQLFLHQRPLYAVAALAAVVIQGLLLDLLTSLLLRGVSAKGDEPP